MGKAGHWLVLLAVAYKESNFNPTARAGGRSTATGLFQINDPTGNDLQDRIWPRFVSKDKPIVPAGKRFNAFRTDPDISAKGAEAILLDKIALRGNDLQRGLDAYGTNAPYGQKVLAGVDAIRQVLGIPAGQQWSDAKILDGIRANPDQVKAALNRTVR